MEMRTKSQGLRFYSLRLPLHFDSSPPSASNRQLVMTNNRTPNLIVVPFCTVLPLSFQIRPPLTDRESHESPSGMHHRSNASQKRRIEEVIERNYEEEQKEWKG